MGAFAVNDVSEIDIDNQYLTIRIDCRACAAWVWALITKLVQTASQRRAIDQQPGDGATEGGDEAHISLNRPWRYRALDWLSQVIYLLMIPPDHFLARLDREVDLSFVDGLCLPEYKWRPGQRGRPPWPPPRRCGRDAPKRQRTPRRGTPGRVLRPPAAAGPDGASPAHPPALRRGSPLSPSRRRC